VVIVRYLQSAKFKYFRDSSKIVISQFIKLYLFSQFVLNKLAIILFTIIFFRFSFTIRIFFPLQKATKKFSFDLQNELMSTKGTQNSHNKLVLIHTF
jgi:hypothetical protein